MSTDVVVDEAAIWDEKTNQPIRSKIVLNKDSGDENFGSEKEDMSVR